MKCKGRAAAVGVMFLGAMACATPKGHAPTPEDKVVVSSGSSATPGEATPGLEAALKQSVGTELLGGNRVSLAENGAVFDTVLDEVKRARSSIHVVIFIWRPCIVGQALADAIAAKAKEGVACRIVVDPAGSHGFEDPLGKQLTAAGCEVHEYKPLTESTPGEYLERNHRKIVVVDGKVAITGGFGIWKSWMGNGREREEWRDSNIRLEGPAVRKLQEAFAQNWKASGGSPLPDDVFPRIPAAGETRAAVVSSTAPQDTQSLSAAERMARALVTSARKRLWIANSYFVPSDELIQLIAEKARAGVDVRVLAPGPVHDWKSIRAAQRDTYKPLLEAGVRIYEYQPTMMHAKTMLVDDRWVAVGSTNLDPLSSKQMEEDTVVLEDRALAAQQEKDFLQDITYSKRIDKSEAGILEKISRSFFWWMGKSL